MVAPSSLQTKLGSISQFSHLIRLCKTLKNLLRPKKYLAEVPHPYCLSNLTVVLGNIYVTYRIYSLIRRTIFYEKIYLFDRNLLKTRGASYN